MLADDAALRNALLDALQAAQLGALKLLHALGLAPDVHGQPGWTFAQRIAVETLAIDGGLTRALLAALMCTGAALVLLALGLGWRRVRWPAWIAAVLLVVLAPWPARSVLLADAVPTSFHRSPTGFEAGSIERGALLYHQHCSSCHGDDGRGEVARAASLPVWPPRLSGQLLWRRAEGEVFWRVAHGMHDRAGTPTMPGFAPALADTQVWALIDAMRALAAGRSVRDEAAWLQPVRAPDVAVRCDDATPARRLASYRGQRVRLVASDYALPNEDPRVLTIALRSRARGAGSDDAGAPRSGCEINDAAAYRAYARVAGIEPAALAGVQWIVDRDGWLRALSPAGRSSWSRSDLLCRSATPAQPTGANGADGLGDLIAAIDADPVRSSAIGVPHRR